MNAERDANGIPFGTQIFSETRRYVKKPIVIEAKMFGCYMDAPDVCEWSGARIGTDSSGRVYLVIPTLEGDMKAEIGDYIIKGIKGEFYPCKSDIFAASYELVDVAKSEPDLVEEVLQEEGETLEYRVTVAEAQEVRRLIGSLVEKGAFETNGGALLYAVGLVVKEYESNFPECE